MQSLESQDHNDRRVFLRTAAGQRAAIYNDGTELDAAQRRLLLLVNGYTPLPDLVAHHLPSQQVPSVVSHLVRAGLIEPVHDSARAN